MPERVRRNALEPALLGISLDKAVDDLPRHWPALWLDEEVRIGVLMLLLAASGEIIPQPFNRTFPDGDAAGLVALSGGREYSRVEIDIGEPKRADLGNAQPAGIHQLKHGPVAESRFALKVRCGKELLDLGLIQKTRQVKALSRRFKVLGRSWARAMIARNP